MQEFLEAIGAIEITEENKIVLELSDGRRFMIVSDYTVNDDYTVSRARPSIFRIFNDKEVVLAKYPDAYVEEEIDKFLLWTNQSLISTYIKENSEEECWRKAAQRIKNGQ